MKKMWKKCSTDQRFIRKRNTTYKIGTLDATSKIVWLHCVVIVVNLWLFWFQFASQSSRDLFSFQNWSCPVNVKTQILGHEWCYRYSNLENYIDRNIHNNKSGREKNPDLNMYIKFIHSEKATQFCEISNNFLPYVLPVK